MWYINLGTLRQENILFYSHNVGFLYLLKDYYFLLLTILILGKNKRCRILFLWDLFSGFLTIHHSISKSRQFNTSCILFSCDLNISNYTPHGVQSFNTIAKLLSTSVKGACFPCLI